MAERVPSDHPSVDTRRGEFTRRGGTRRPCLRLPALADLEEGEVIRLSLSGTQYHARVDADSRGLLLRGAYDNRRLAREPGAGDNRLLAWAGEHDLGGGDAVGVDEVEPGHLYGVRAPGERAVYEAVAAPDESLRNIARDLGDG